MARNGNGSDGKFEQRAVDSGDGDGDNVGSGTRGDESRHRGGDPGRVSSFRHVVFVRDGETTWGGDQGGVGGWTYKVQRRAVHYLQAVLWFC